MFFFWAFGLYSFSQHKNKVRIKFSALNFIVTLFFYFAHEQTFKFSRGSNNYPPTVIYQVNSFCNLSFQMK